MNTFAHKKKSPDVPRTNAWPHIQGTVPPVAHIDTLFSIHTKEKRRERERGEFGFHTSTKFGGV
jgi:hypothetical protein